jgi:hypothetical protein
MQPELTAEQVLLMHSISLRHAPPTATWGGKICLHDSTDSETKPFEQLAAP